MPIVRVGRDRLFKALGRTYTEEEFKVLGSKIGICLDAVTTEKAIIRKEKHLKEDETEEGEEVIYKIEVHANRYDLLCMSGIARALRICIGEEKTPVFKTSNIPANSMLKMHVKSETKQIRPFIVCAILRGITFDESIYNSFIDLQDKLHENICSKRKLATIGTHDLDTLEGPFSYEALVPSEINFIPLKQTKSYRADELMELYKSDLKLKKFLHIIENSPLYPVIYDNKRTVLSLPPIINGAHSAITLNTKNIFIECTGTDLTKANIVLNTMVTMFSEYCEKKFEVEPVEVIYPEGKSVICPDVEVIKTEIPLKEIVNRIGIELDETQVVELLNKMQLQPEKKISQNGDISITVLEPPTRSDILHSCDITEDVAVAYGYNNIIKAKPIFRKQKPNIKYGVRQPLSCLSDKIRHLIAWAGYMEVLTFMLGSIKESFEMVNRIEDIKKAVLTSNPRTSESEAVRVSLLPGLLKSLKHNIAHPRPIKIFEVGNIVTLDPSRAVGASSNRKLGVLYCNVNSGFEEILGLVDWLLKEVKGPNFEFDYMKSSEEPEFFEQRQFKIVMKSGRCIGKLGIIHWKVLENFGIRDPCSFLEVDIQAIL